MVVPLRLLATHHHIAKNRDFTQPTYRPISNYPQTVSSHVEPTMAGLMKAIALVAMLIAAPAAAADDGDDFSNNLFSDLAP
jgi:hypothetical protein